VVCRVNSPANKNQKRRGGRRDKGRDTASSAITSSLAPGVTNRRYTQSQTGLAPFPLRWNARLTYGVNVAVGTIGSIPTANSYRFRLNSLYDPDFSGLGNQPYQYDQLTAVYAKYIVYECHVDLTFTDPSTDGLWVGWSFHSDTDNNDTPNGLTLGDIMSRPNFRCVPINNTGQQFITIREHIPIHTVFGISRQQYAPLTDTYGAAYNANPVSNAYLDLFVLDPNSLVTPQYVRVAGRLVYTCQFFEYVAPAAS